MQKIEMADGPDQFGCALKGQRLGSSPFSSPPPSSPALSLVAWQPLASVADKDLDEDENDGFAKACMRKQGEEQMKAYREHGEVWHIKRT